MPETSTFVEVLLDQNLSKPLDYAVPPQWQTQIAVGMRVEIPLKSSIKKGTIVKIKHHSAHTSVREIARVISETAELTDAQWKLAHWISRYYAAPMQRVLKCFIPPNIRREIKPKTQLFVTLNASRSECLEACRLLQVQNPEEALILEAVLNSKKGCILATLKHELNVSQSAFHRLRKKQLLSIEKLPHEPDLLLEEEFFQTSAKTLNEEQSQALNKIQTALAASHFSAHLLHGVTGSGKTEIYLQAIAKALEQQKGAILLVPEISLTSQTIERFRSRFSEKLAILHHKRSFGERSLAWDQLRSGKIRIVIGARSAVFAPMPNLGLIIVDEEHDNSYKQSEESPFYHARNVAVMRAYLEQATIVLGSATPSIESRYNVDIGKYQLHILKTRATSASLPQMHIIDMKKTFEIHGGFTHFSSELLKGIENRLKLGEQTLLFLNRRGYHRLQVCGSCSSVIKCPHCDLGLTYHREAALLQCHLCDFRQSVSRCCSTCGSADALVFKGFGTEHVERSLHAIFPEIRTLRMDRDTTQKKHSHEEIFKQFRAHKADVLIGTQMIAKGFHFPSVTLVGVLNADAQLSIPDFRSSELVFQLLIQVAGRSGRSDLPGEVILQTFLPNHSILKLAALQDYDAFYQAEIEQRRLFQFPPFCHLIKCLFLSPDLEMAKNDAAKAHHFLTTSLPPATQILPVIASGYPKIKDLYRFQFLIKTAKIEPLSSLLQTLPSMKSQIKIDIDPSSTFF